MNENPQQILGEKAVAELRKLRFTGTEQINETDRRRKIRCLHIHSRVDGGRGLLTVLAVGGGKGMLIVCLHLNMHRRLEARRCCLSFYPFSILFIYDLISALL